MIKYFYELYPIVQAMLTFLSIFQLAVVTRDDERA